MRPKLCYGAIAWGHTTRLDSKKEALDKLNRLAATMITPVRKSKPVKTMEILYDLISLYLYIQKEARLGRTKSKKKNIHRPLKILGIQAAGSQPSH